MRPFTVLTLCLMPSDLSVDFPLWTPLCDGRDGRSSFLQRSRLVQGACPETGAKRANQPAVCNLLGLKATCCEGLRCWLVLKHSNPTIGYAQDLGYSIWVMNIATGRQDERSSIVVRGHGVLSPDGSRVVRCDEGLHLIDGESQLRIVDKGWGVAWSPDGTRFVYCREDGLYVTDGTHRERVAVMLKRALPTGRLTVPWHAVLSEVYIKLLPRLIKSNVSSSPPGADWVRLRG